MKKLLVIIILSFVFGFNTAKAGRVGLYIGANLDTPKYTLGNDFSPVVGGAGGILINLPFSFEIGLQVLQRNFDYNIGNSTISYSEFGASLPILWRFLQLGPLSIGGGGYFLKNFGKIKSTTLGVSKEREYAALGLKTFDYGLVASLRIDFGIFIDARYQHGFVKSPPNSNLYYTDIQALVGYSF